MPSIVFKKPLLKLARAICANDPFARGVTWRGVRDTDAVALTFDDGPNPDFTGRVLDLLAEESVSATFFVEGERVERHPDMLGRIVEHGHAVGIHCHTHERNDVRRQIARCAAVLSSVKVKTRLYRPPYGTVSPHDLLWLIGKGYRTILWSFDTRDSMRCENKWPGAVPDYSNINSGDIVLMHDDNALCLEELPRIIKGIQRRRLSMVTVPQLLLWE